MILLKHDASLPAIRKALEIATIKMAVDGNPKAKAAFEDALRDVNEAAVDNLSDRPSGIGPEGKMVRCFLTVGELKIIVDALTAAVTVKDGQHDWKHVVTGWRALIVRAKTTIALNG